MPGTARRAAAKLALAVQYALPAAGLPARSAFRRWVKAALRGPAELSLRVVDEAEGRALNRAYRGKDYATNVLSFAYGEIDDGSGSLRLSGDVVLCAPVVAAEALAQGKILEAHYAHLTVHGLLHLQGYDHESAPEAIIMERREADILKGLGYDDPYRSEKR